MCNRYRIEVEFDELWHTARPQSDMTNRANPTTEVFPDKPEPVIRNNAEGERELINLTWGMPPRRRSPMASRITASPIFAI